MEISSGENNYSLIIPEINEPYNKEKPCKNKFKRNTACRRFTDEQIRSLESIFSLETKLEPKKKQKVAEDLGLEPRQVAIWFQNRRARGKSKQTAREFKVLKAKYDSLYMKLDELRREKTSLEMQLKELSYALENQDKADLAEQVKDYSYISNSNEDDQNSKYKYIRATEELERDKAVGWGEDENISLLTSSTTTWHNTSYDGLFDKSFCGSNWWES